MSEHYQIGIFDAVALWCSGLEAGKADGLN
jgi:hypothetical protein